MYPFAFVCRPLPSRLPQALRFSLLFAAIASGGYAQSIAPIEDSFPSLEELRGLTLEDVADLRITTATRRSERLRDTPAAVSVVTNEDIRRSAIRNIPDALRLAAGVHVARANNINAWAVGVRGFTFTTTNKLLVLRDGRSLYSPLFSGVFWDAQDTLMADIDRIEVIRGPGGTLWGANAVNGVINIISKDAKETQGPLLIGGAGDREDGLVSARYGGQVGEKTWYRVYARGWDRDDVLASDGSHLNEHRRFGQGGFRIDGTPSPAALWTLQGEIYDGRNEWAGQEPTDIAGHHLLGRWTLAPDSERRVRIQTYYDYVEREVPALGEEQRDTFDVELDQRIPIGDRHDFLWGATARYSKDSVQNTPTLAFEPSSRGIHLVSGFVQDRISLVEDVLDLTVGTKLEHNTYTDFEVQPSVSLAWTPTESHTVWAAISRAVRIPSRFDRDVIRINTNTGTESRGSSDFASEKLVAYEIGYRVRPLEPLTFDFALYYHDYNELRGITSTDPQFYSNLFKGETYGGEVTATFHASEWWRLRLGYAHLQKDLHTRPGMVTDAEAEGNDPKHIAFLQSRVNIGERWAFDSVLRFVSELPDPKIPSYTELDLQLAWLAREDLELSIAGRNLIDRYHREFGSTHAVPRTVFFRVKWGL